MGSLTRHRLLCRKYRFQFRLGWDDDPCKQVRDDARTNSGGEREEDADDAHERYVEIEMVSQAGTNARDLFLGAGAHQFLRRGRNPHCFAAVGAKVAVLGDVFAASVAVHDCASLRFRIRGLRGECSALAGGLATSSLTP